MLQQVVLNKQLVVLLGANTHKGFAMTEKFSEIVKRVRYQLSLSQEDLAHKIGVSFATINRWENGKTAPSRLALAQFDIFCEDMINKGKLAQMGRDDV